MTMARAHHVELDFLGLQNDAAAAASPAHQPSQPHLDRRRSFSGISKINPEIVKSILAKPENAFNSSSVPATPNRTEHAALPPTSDRNHLPQFPIFRPHLFSRSSEKAPETAPMTIFYKGTVSVFDLPKEKAEDVMKFAMEKGSGSKTDEEVQKYSGNAQNENILQGADDGDLPIKRKKSLQRFFEKRKERLISVSPYSTDHVLKTSL